jgi:hypothetical protein
MPQREKGLGKLMASLLLQTKGVPSPVGAQLLEKAYFYETFGRSRGSITVYELSQWNPDYGGERHADNADAARVVAAPPRRS